MKKVLKQQASELDAYIKRKHTQEECIGFIDGFERANELFDLYGVSQQRELLKKWWKYFDEESVAINCNDEEREEVINNFFNCG